MTMHSVHKPRLFSTCRSSILKFLVIMSMVIPNCANAQTQNALIRAAFNGDLKTVDELLARGVNVNEQNNEGITALFMAAYRGHLEVVKSLLSHGADVNAQTTKGHDTPLIVASQNGHIEVVNELLKKNPDVNAQNSQGATPLILASAKGYTAVVRVLLASGADVKVKTYNDKMTALDVAKQSHRQNIVKILELGTDDAK